ncbi:MAG: hypothetical protein ACK6CU_20745 [Deltaproteobacteria bacterium]|jgi:hypothetical protein
MQRLWLGDALDFWKGSLLEVLRTASTPPSPLSVLPMFTDTGWTQPELATYAGFLGLPPSALLTTSQLTKPGRAHYFATIASGFQGDVFLDPDNGIAPSKPEPAHVAAAEVFALLTHENVVAVYQHRPQRVSAPWLARYVQLVIATGARVVGYESAQVGMLFVTKSASRESAVRQALANRLGAVAVARGSFAGRLI